MLPTFIAYFQHIIYYIDFNINKLLKTKLLTHRNSLKLLITFVFPMNYQNTIQYLYQKLPMFTRVGAAAYKADLSNTMALCNSLGHPEKKFKSIHIAGTNGKGSCSHMLASVFQSAGYKTGLYTSPHISDFKERIKINGLEIDENWLVRFVERFIPVIDEIDPSFFEVSVAMAFEYFAQEQVDIAIIETGLGGLLDSTNVILPELSIITNISFDHTNLLGHTLEEIARQKAGIIKPLTPVVIGESNEVLTPIFKDVAKANHSEIFFAEEEYEFVDSSLQLPELKLHYSRRLDQSKAEVEIDLLGSYQIKNVRTVITAIDVLTSKGWKINQEQLLKGLKFTKRNTGLKGRFDMIHQQPLIITDVAHNEAGLREVFNQIKSLPYKQLHVVTGFVKDKDIEKALSTFPPDAIFYFTQADIPRALPFKELNEIAGKFGLKGLAYETVNNAMKQAMNNAGKDDLILVTGSFFILEDVYKLIELKNTF